MFQILNSNSAYSVMTAPSISSGFVNHEVGSTGSKIRKNVFGIILDFLSDLQYFQLGWNYSTSSCSCDILAYLILLGKVCLVVFYEPVVTHPWNKAFSCSCSLLLQRVCVRTGLPSAQLLPRTGRRTEISTSLHRKQMSLNYTHPSKNTSELWGDPRLGKSGIRICSDLCHYPNNSTRPWNLKSKWNHHPISSASAKPEFGNILILEHMSRVKVPVPSSSPLPKSRAGSSAWGQNTQLLCWPHLPLPGGCLKRTLCPW